MLLGLRLEERERWTTAQIEAVNRFIDAQQ
jgi:hypothetical protein